MYRSSKVCYKELLQGRNHNKSLCPQNEYILRIGRTYIFNIGNIVVPVGLLKSCFSRFYIDMTRCYVTDAHTAFKSPVYISPTSSEPGLAPSLHRAWLGAWPRSVPVYTIGARHRANSTINVAAVFFNGDVPTSQCKLRHFRVNNRLSALIYKWAEHGDLFTLQIDRAEHRQCGPSPVDPGRAYLLSVGQAHMTFEWAEHGRKRLHYSGRNKEIISLVRRTSNLLVRHSHHLSNK